LSGRALALLAAVAFLTACRQEPRAPDVDEILRDAGYRSVPTTGLPSSGIATRIRLNGHEFSVVVDTGSTETCLDRDVAEREGFRLVPSTRTAKLLGKRGVPTWDIDVESISLDTVPIRRPSVAAVDMEPIVKSYDTWAIHGVVGVRELSRVGAVLRFDTLSLHLRGEGDTPDVRQRLIEAGYEEVEVRGAPSRLLVPVDLDGRRLWFLVDSGRGDTVLDSGTAKTHGLQVTGSSDVVFDTMSINGHPIAKGMITAEDLGWVSDIRRGGTLGRDALVRLRAVILFDPLAVLVRRPEPSE
jgi:predicted aspartyl protease